MATELNGLEIPNWLIGLGASAASALGGFILALLNRGPAMQSILDSRFRALIEAYEGRIDDLSKELHALREEVINLRKALDNANRPPPPSGFGA